MNFRGGVDCPRGIVGLAYRGSGARGILGDTGCGYGHCIGTFPGYCGK